MDDRARNELLAKLADATKQEAQSRERLQAHAAAIEQVREALGNPYFYSGRSAEDPESEAHFSGYRSHEPAFLLWQEWHDVSQQVAAIRQQLKDAG
jgi:hypothetical protein